MRLHLRIVAVGLSLLASAGVAGQETAQQTPEALARELLSAVRARDDDRAKALIDVRTATEAEALDPGVTDRTIAGWFKLDLPEDTTIEILEPEQMKGFDAAGNAFVMGPLRVQFLDKVEKIATLSHDVRTASSVRGRSITVALVRRDTGWRIMLAPRAK